jgi:hypothetical protein
VNGFRNAFLISIKDAIVSKFFTPVEPQLNRAAAIGAAMMVLFCASSAVAALVYVDKDSRADWPTSAPILTSPVLPEFEGDLSGVANSRGVRSNRIQAQTFRVNRAFSVDRIFIGYRWNNNSIDPLAIRLLEVNDVGVLYPPAAANVVAGPLGVVVGDRPDPGQANNYYAMELKWDAALSGNQPLVLSPRPNNQGYALEFVGPTTTSAVAILIRNDNPVPGSRAMEQDLNGTPTGPSEASDWVVAITGSYLPIPGDFDGDDDVDGADFVAWQTNFPKATDATRAHGDADGDGDVDGADFVVWQTNFPFSPSPGAASPVPEPNAFWLAALASAASLAARRRFMSL